MGTDDWILTADVCVYGATPAGIMSAIAAARSGLTVVLVEPTEVVGGLLSSGLNATDAPVPNLIKGIVREFFSRCSEIYGSSVMAIRHESKVCEDVFAQMLKDDNVIVLKSTRLEMVRKIGARIIFAQTDSGKRIEANWWVDGTYEGDLLPLAQISYAIGRESKEEFNEAQAGVGKPGLMYAPLMGTVDPFRNGSVLPHVEPYEYLAPGSADWRVQAYCHRLTLTDNKDNQTPIKKPDSYNPDEFELFRRLISADVKFAAINNTARNDSIRNGYLHIAHLPNGKVDFNSGHLVPTNNPILSQGWISASHIGRRRIGDEFRAYTEGIIWFLRTDPVVPSYIRKIMSKYWYPADEFGDGFPPLLYVREGRRLLGDKVTTVHDLLEAGSSGGNSIGEGAYHLDCKPARWYANRDGNNVLREGQFFSKNILKFDLPISLILPRAAEAINAVVVSAVSASHVAFGSIRMEPTWMTLGAGAGSAIALAHSRGSDIRGIPSSEIREKMIALASKRYLFPGK